MFRPVEVTWKGETFTIPANRMMGAIASIEEFVTLSELVDTVQKRNTVKLASLSAAYAAVLNYAGAKVTQEQVYEGVFKQGGMGLTFVVEATQTLILMMVPPMNEVEQTKGKDNRHSRRVASRLSKRRIKRQ